MSDKTPVHVAIIMDGNGRWALSLGKNRTYGHYIGSKVVDKITKAASGIGIKYLTLYTFSTENWKRPKSEIRFIISLLNIYLKKAEKLFCENNIKFNFIGNIKAFPEKTQNILQSVTQKTKHNETMTLILALNYGSRLEITQACKKIAKDAKEGKLSIKDISEGPINSYLCTKGMPDVDLLIRTGSEKRISNFLLWEASYAEFVFLDKYWPEFTKSDFIKAIKEFKKRQRNFGGLRQTIKLFNGTS